MNRLRNEGGNIRKLHNLHDKDADDAMSGHYDVGRVCGQLVGFLYKALRVSLLHPVYPRKV